MARPKVIPKEPDLLCNSIITHDCRKKGAACRSLQISKPTLCKTILSSAFVLESRTETDKLAFFSLHTYIHTYFIGSSPRGFSESILHYKIINQVHDNKNITMIKEDKGQ